MSLFLDNFYGVLFNPEETFDKLKEEKPVYQSLIIVLFISIIGLIIGLNLKELTTFIIQVFFALIGGVVSWIFFAGFIELVASIFKHEGKYKELLTLTGFALLPWLFLAPIEVIKSAGSIGTVFGVIFALIVWIWVIVLMLKAISKTYDISINRTLLIMIIPAWASIINFYWIIGFWKTIFGIFS